MKTLLAAILLLAGCAPTMRKVVDDAAWPPAHRADGTIRCESGQPEPWLTGRAALRADRLVTLAHEFMHAEDAKAAGGCARFLLALQDDTYRLAVEARAFCVSARTAVRIQLQPTLAAAYAYYASLLTDPGYGWPGELTTAEAISLIRTACKDP